LISICETCRLDSDILLAVREAKMEKAKILKREMNMRERKGGIMAGTLS
jgi:hypothetical protein